MGGTVERTATFWLVFIAAVIGAYCLTFGLLIAAATGDWALIGMSLAIGVCSLPCIRACWMTAPDCGLVLVALAPFRTGTVGSGR